MSTARILDGDETTIPPSYSTSNMPKTTPVMIMQQSRRRRSSSSRMSSRGLATVASSANNVDYCHLCFALLNSASKCILLNEEIGILIINQLHIRLDEAFAKKNVRPEKLEPEAQWEPMPNSFCPGSESPKHNGGEISNTLGPGNCSPWSSDEARASTGTSVSVA